MENLSQVPHQEIINNLLLENIDEKTLYDAEHWLCILKDLYLIYEGATTQVIEAAQQRANDTGESISEVIQDWATSYQDHKITLLEREQNQ